MAVGLGFEEGMNAFTAAGLYAILSAALACAAPMAHAAPPEKLLQPAGPPPADAMAKAAIVKYFEGKGRALDRRKPFKVLSGPTLATGNTFAGGIEQAWLMCLVVNAEKTSPGPSDIKGQAIYLRRNAAGMVVVVPIENWKDSSPQCDR